MKLPKIMFSDWKRWDDRRKAFNHIVNQSGVYLLAHFNKPPRGRASPTTKNVIYIGETCRMLQARWNQFERSAFNGKFGHSGGKTYKEKYPKGKRDNLYVAVFRPNIPDDKFKPLFIKFVERKLILDYVRKYKKLPNCNRG